MKYHIIPHFHYDLAWTSQEHEYLEVVFKILKEINIRMGSYPKLTYVLDQGYYLEKLKAHDLKLYNSIANFIGTGRIEFVQGGYIAPDLNLVSERVLLANYQKNIDFGIKEFGVKPEIMWNIDAFGHHGMMPKIATTMGCKGYVLWRGAAEGQPLNFVWRGSDGTIIPTARFRGPLGYSLYSKYFPNLQEVITKYTETDPKQDIMIPMGSDFAYPDDNLIGQVLLSTNCEFSTPSKFFKTINWTKTPIVQGEFLNLNPLCPILMDCWGARTEVKKLYRAKENDPTTPMDDLIYGSFHDLVCGTAIDEAYKPMKKKLGTYSYIGFPNGSNTDVDLEQRLLVLSHPDAGDLYNMRQVKDTTSYQIPRKFVTNKTSKGTELRVDCETILGWRTILMISTGEANQVLTDKVPGGKIDRGQQVWSCCNGGFSYGTWEIEEFGTPQHIVMADGRIYIVLNRSVSILSWGDAGPVMYVPEAMEKGKHSYKFIIRREDNV